MRRLIILGSTGSVGTQALDIVRANPDLFQVAGLAAGGSRTGLLAAQAAEFPGAATAVGVTDATRMVRQVEADVVLNGITGSVGLGPTLAALQAGRILALANKESLVAGGALVTGAAAPGQIVPVDSEHSALAQCLRSGTADEVAALVLTASGGPFRGRTREQLAGITPAEALAHPTWAMGPVVTINSATLVNKGLEVIEAHLLFGVPYRQIQVVVHPQSIVHSMVTFTDGSTLAQASPPDMRLPIALGLHWPHRVPGAARALDVGSPMGWTFEPVDDHSFPALGLARRAGESGGLVPAVFNAANEELVAEFVAGTLPFTGIAEHLERMLDSTPAEFGADPTSIAEVTEAEDWARRTVRDHLELRPRRTPA